MAFGWGTNLTNDFEDCAPTRDRRPQRDLAGLQGHRGERPPGGQALRQSGQGDRRPQREIERYLQLFGEERCARRAALLSCADRIASGSCDRSRKIELVGHRPLRVLRPSYIAPATAHHDASPTPPIAATSCCCRPATTSSAAPSPVAASFLVLAVAATEPCRPAGRGAAAAVRHRRRRSPAAQPALLCLPRRARRRRPSWQPRSAVQSAAAVVWTLLWVGLTLVQGLIGNLWAGSIPGTARWRIDGRVAAADAHATRLLPQWLGYLAGGAAVLRLRLVRADLPGARRPGAAGGGRRPLLGGQLRRMLMFGYALEPAGRVPVGLLRHDGAAFGFLSANGRSRPAQPLLARRASSRNAAPLPSSGVLFLLLALASVSFDGLSKTFFWLGMNGVNPLEFPGRTAMIGISTAGLVLTFAALSARIPARASAPASGLAGGADGFLGKRQAFWSGRSCRSRSPTISRTT